MTNQNHRLLAPLLAPLIARGPAGIDELAEKLKKAILGARL